MKIQVLLFLIVWVCSGLVKASEVIDDIGQKIILKHPAQRIISLAPDLTEMLFTVGAGSHIVGVINRSDYPLAAKKIPVVAGDNTINIEAILRLQPDLILVWSESHWQERLKQWGIPVFVSHPERLIDIAYTVRRLGSLTGNQQRANRVSQDFLQRYEALKKTYIQKKKLSVFYQVWSQPFITITKKSWINDVIVLCHGKNIFENIRGIAPTVSVESILIANPDVIIASSVKEDWKKYWHQWPYIHAVQNQRLISIDPDLIERASPRVLDGAEVMCRGMTQ